LAEPSIIEFRAKSRGFFFQRASGGHCQRDKAKAAFGELTPKAASRSRKINGDRKQKIRADL
jgi:hypothetical protein